MRRSAAERRDLLGPARRETVDGLPVLHLAGTPYAIGFQHGALCRDDIPRFGAAIAGFLAKL